VSFITEHGHQVLVVDLLRRSGLLFAASLNGVRLSPGQRRKASAAGMEAGEPDICIYTPPPAVLDCVGMMIEMKPPKAKPRTKRGGPFSGCKPHQRERLALLQGLGWHCVVGYGATDAIEKLQAAGYPLQVL